MVLGVDSYVMVLHDFKITLWFALMLLSGTGNGYDEWSLNSYFTDGCFGSWGFVA